MEHESGPAAQAKTASPADSTAEAHPAAAEDRYEREIDLEGDSTHARVVRLVGSNRRVLELGPATGHMTSVLRDHGCTVVGIEVDPEMANVAARYSERTIIGDLDELDLDEELGSDRFDVIVAADVLEHLKDPLRALKRLRAFLAPTGFFVISLPNVAHGSVRLALLEGHFPYQDVGLLDRTHLRFFTRESIDELLDEAELGAAEIFRQPLNLEASEVPFDAGAVPAGLLEVLSRDPEARTYQFVIKAIPIEAEGMREMQRRMRELAHGSALVRDRIAELETENAQLRKLSEYTGELRAALIEAHDQVLRRDEEVQRLRPEVDRLRTELNVERDNVLRLRVRLERIFSSPPMRAYQMIARLPGLQTLKTGRAAAYEKALRGAKGDG